MEFDEQPTLSLSAGGSRRDWAIDSTAESFRARTGFPRASVFLDWGFAVRGSNENRKPERGSCGVPQQTHSIPLAARKDGQLFGA